MTRNCVEYALFAGESVAEADPKWCPGCTAGYASITDVLRSDALLSKKKYVARCLKDDFPCTFKPAPGTPWGTGHQQFTVLRVTRTSRRYRPSGVKASGCSWRMAAATPTGQHTFRHVLHHGSLRQNLSALCSVQSTSSTGRSGVSSVSSAGTYRTMPWVCGRPGHT